MAKSLHHLLRVRMRTTRFERLQQIAEEETKTLETYVSVSDLVRIAIDNWLQTYDCKERLKTSLDELKRQSHSQED